VRGSGGGKKPPQREETDGEGRVKRCGEHIPKKIGEKRRCLTKGVKGPVEGEGGFEREGKFHKIPSTHAAGLKIIQGEEGGKLGEKKNRGARKETKKKVSKHGGGKDWT